MTGFKDGVSNTLLVVEAGVRVPWIQPEVLHFAPDLPLPRFAHEFRSRGPVKGSFALMADGSVWFLKAPIDEKTMRALVTRNGGESVDLSRIGTKVK